MFENPFGTNLQDLQQNYYQQLAAMQQMQQKQGSSSILEEINKVVSGMSSDEQAMMSESPEYIMAKQTYEAGFMGFLGQKFSQEYVNPQEGKTAANNLLNSIKRIKDNSLGKNPRSKKVYDNKGNEYSCLKELSNLLNINYSTLRSRFRKSNKLEINNILYSYDKTIFEKDI